MRNESIAPAISQPRVLRQVKTLLMIFMVCLVVSGLTAFPIDWQLSLAHSWVAEQGWNNGVAQWLEKVYQGVHDTYSRYPFMAYGTDWLAFAHLVIAVAFIGPWRDPVRNVWVVEFGMIACVAILPLAFIAGPVRGIPLFWQLIDCSFGVVGLLLLWVCRRKIAQLEKLAPYIPN
jgi:hypothetical protein